MKGYFCVLLCLTVSLTVRGARRVDVEDLVREVKERYADDFEQRSADGNPPEIEDLLELTKEEDLDQQTTLVAKKAGEKVKFQQLYEGVPVFDTIVTATKDKDSGTATKDIKGTIVKDLSDDVGDAKAEITAEEALKVAKEDAGHSGKETTGEDAKLSIYMDKDDVGKLAFITNYYSPTGGDKGPSRPFHVIDAKTKEVIDKWEGIAFHKVTGEGGNAKIGKYMYDGQEFGKLDVTLGSSGNCNLENKDVKVVHMHSGEDERNKPLKMDTHIFNCKKGNKDEANGAYSPLNDALYFGGIIMNMYREWLGQSPLTQKLVMRVHYGNNFENAYWNGIAMTFGDGHNTFHPLVCLDVSAHEVSHGFTEQNSGLVYRYQSGGINEAFSDMAGEAAKFYMRGSNDWKVGSDIFKRKGALRYMDDPTKDGISIGHAKDYTDEMDVHHTSGVYNKAFYILANKDNWDTRKAFEAFAHANMLYWSANTGYDEGACGVMSAAADAGRREKDVADAFKEVGVECKKRNAVQKVTSE